MAKKVKQKIKQKLSNFAKDGKISKKESKRIGKISGGSIGTKGLTNLVNRYSKNNQLKINKRSDKLIGQTNVRYANSLGGIPGDNFNFPDRNNKQIVPGISSPEVIAAAAEGGNKDRFGNLTDRIDEGLAGFQDQLDGMFAGQDARDAELERQEQERLRQFELAQRTMLGNEGRSGQQATYRLGGAAGRMKGGTSGFKRRKGSGASRIMSGLSANSGGTLNV
tara:strand:- start:46 stop:711 length:666 start_codon:yes stop_codon:yes gene_type:complete